jgi:hypothetical protein
MSIGTSTTPRPMNSTRAIQKREIIPNRALFKGESPEESHAAPTFGLNSVSFGKRPLTPQFVSPEGEVGRRLNFLA